MNLPLQGVRVVDFGQGVAGPYCAMLLADLGARVIKVEPKRGDWGRTMGSLIAPNQSSTFLSVNRNKKGLCLDLKTPRGREIAKRLIGKSEVVVESFRPGVMQQFGLGYQELRREFPGIIYCSISGFGQTGPYIDLPAGDSTMQALGGLMSINGEPGQAPLRLGMVVSDMIAGMTAFEGVLAALLSKSQTQEGQQVTVSLLDALVAFQAPTITEYLVSGSLPKRSGNSHPLVAPSGVLETKDSYIMVTVLDQKWVAFCEAMGFADLAVDSRFSTNRSRVENKDALTEKLRPVFLEKTTDKWLEYFRRLEIPCAPINDYESLLSDPQVIENGLILSLPQNSGKNVPIVRHATGFSKMEIAYSPPPRIGEHTREILVEDLGYEVAKVSDLEEKQIVLSHEPAPALHPAGGGGV